MPKRPEPLDDARAALRRGFVIIGIVSLATGLLMLASPLYMLQIYDRVLSTGNTDTLLALSAMIVVALVTYAALEGLRTLVAQRVGVWLEQRLGAPVLVSAVSQALQRSGGTAQGLRDITTVRGFVGSPAIFPLFDAPMAPLFLAVLFIMHPALGLVALVGAVILFGIGLINELITRKALREASGASSKAWNAADATVRNADAIMAMAMLPALARRMEQHSAAWRGLQRRAGGRSGMLTAIAKGTRLLLQSAILGTGAWLVLSGKLTPGMMIAASIMMGRALAPVEQAITAWQGLINAQAAWGRLRELLAARPNLGQGTSLPRPEGLLEADNVFYQPPGAPAPVLNGISFRIEPGTITGIIGPTGAGKSSLARCIVGSARPARGTIRLDSADMKGWDPLDRGQHVGYVPQDVELFDGTVAENIARFTESEDEAIVAAARLAGAHEMILKLPNGYETEIGDAGARLSGGQRQRLALARAVFSSPRLLVLDEPNASLDAAGEDSLLRMVTHLAEQGSTILLVTHKPSILRTAHKVMVIEEGRVSRFGPRDEIISRQTPRPMPDVAAERPSVRVVPGGSAGA
ncbi:MAG: type I secretion system permease/ATPase [Minwuia sp.]|nr:type I secretion system permease/ATPase [Minwuia sp.]